VFLARLVGCRRGWTRENLGGQGGFFERAESSLAGVVLMGWGPWAVALRCAWSACAAFPVIRGWAGRVVVEVQNTRTVGIAGGPVGWSCRGAKHYDTGDSQIIPESSTNPAGDLMGPGVFNMV
jgi:hypothetical protein